MSYMDKNEIRAYKIPTENTNEPVRPLNGYDYWHCPRCKRILDSANGRFVNKCLNCKQVIKWDP